MRGLRIFVLKDNNSRVRLRMNATLSPSLFSITLPLLNKGKGRKIRKQQNGEE
jgi:hypothetical protein